MPSYIWGYDETLGRNTWVPKPERVANSSKVPYYWTDIPEYKSPLGTGWVTSRSQRREELKRSGCREVEPSEYKPAYLNPKYRSGDR